MNTSFSPFAVLTTLIGGDALFYFKNKSAMTALGIPSLKSSLQIRTREICLGLGTLPSGTQYLKRPSPLPCQDPFRTPLRDSSHPAPVSSMERIPRRDVSLSVSARRKSGRVKIRPLMVQAEPRLPAWSFKFFAGRK